MKVKLDPQLLQDAILTVPKSNPSYWKGQTYIALSTQPRKKYSFVIRLGEVEEDESLRIPKLRVNKNQIGALAHDDIVELYPYQIPGAKSITIGLSQDYGTITPGDWTAGIKDLLVNNIYDENDPIKAPIDVNGKILILRGFLMAATPQAPIQIDPTTQILIDKPDESTLDEYRGNLEQNKIDRTDVLVQTIFNSLIENIQQANLQSGSFSMEMNLKKLPPKLFDEAISSLFDSFDCYKTETISDTKSKYAVVKRYVKQKENIPETVIIYRFTTGKTRGTLSVKCKSITQTYVDSFIEEYRKKIQTIYINFKDSLSKREKQQYLQTKILEYSEHLPPEEKSHVPLAQIYQDLQENFPDWEFSIKVIRKILQKMQKNGLIADLKQTESGFYMIEFHPAELTIDPAKLLQYGQDVHTCSKEKLLTHFQWDEYRLQKALNFLISRNLVKLQSSYREGTIYFFKNK